MAFSGHKRLHGIKFQGVTTPDGIIQEILGPFVGTMHDARILAESGLMEKLENSCLINGEWYYLYGDPAYPIRPYLLPPFKGRCSVEQTHMNSLMSKVRQSVEWTFKDITQNFAFVDYKMKLYLQPVAKYYQVGAILFNCKTCLRNGNQTSKYFNCEPPSVTDYLNRE